MMKLLPPMPHLCQACAYDHPPDYPHNLTFYYQFLFNMQHGRRATWEDAIAHCTEEIKQIVRDTLAEIN